jgi:hypothetical protein
MFSITMSATTQIAATDWKSAFSPDVQQTAVTALEDGSVLFLPQLCFKVIDGEARFLTPELVGSSKNVSYNHANKSISHVNASEADKSAVAGMMDRFSASANDLVNSLLPGYQGRIARGRTSLRPVEAAGRGQSWRSDDTRLHVDAFPTTPLNGRRILRVFTNVNPSGRARSWKIGEPFSQVTERFIRSIKPPAPGSLTFMQLFRVTKGRRSLYDHYMLGLHDSMKADNQYQETCPQTKFDFPALTTWMVFSDSVPHAVTAGQHQFEQTFYLEPEGMAQPDKSPLRILEKHLGRNLRN